MEKAIFKEIIIATFINTTDFGPSSGKFTRIPSIINPPALFTNQSNEDGANMFIIDGDTLTALRIMFAPEADKSVWGGVSTRIGVEEPYNSEFSRLVRQLDPVTGLSKVMENIASSMTKRMREAPFNGTIGLGPTANGTLYQHVPYDNVRWGWITFPTVLVLLVLLFLLATMVQHAKEGNMLWSANTLANFYHPLTKDGRDELQSGHNAVEAEEIAERVKVKWARIEAGVRLVQRHGT